MISRFTPDYLEFRQTLSNGQLLNLRAHVINASAAGAIHENTLSRLDIGGARIFQIYVFKAKSALWFLGGHWVRAGEPSKAFLERLHRHVEEISEAPEP